MKERTSISLILLAVSLSGNGQIFYNQADIHIGNVTLYADGDVVNNGLMHNGGLIAFTGDWKNEGTYGGDGTVEANGSAPQIIAHGGQSIENVTVSGWGTKYLRGLLVVSGNLRLAQGVVEVSPDDALILSASARATGSVDSYVDGALTVEGGGYKFFPVGKNGVYAPMEFLDVPLQAGRYSLEVFDNAPTISAENIVVRRSLYWQRRDIVGEFRGSAIAIDFERDFFDTPQNIVLLTGDDFNKPFQVVSELGHSEETDKIFTQVTIHSKIIMLGEISDAWTSADFYLPTALSPHAEYSENKSIRIFGDRLDDDQFQFRVFNRWGDLVYESRSLEHMHTGGWDGRTSGGIQLATGTYPYRLTGFDKMGKRFERKGVITIVH